MNIFKRFNKKTSESIPNLELPRGTTVMVPIKERKDNMQDILTGYKIFTKEDYKRYRLQSLDAFNISEGILKNIDESWRRISNGYNFIIGVGKNKLMFYSVDYFNDKVLGPRQSTVTIKLDTKEFDKKIEEWNEEIKQVIKRLSIDKRGDKRWLKRKQHLRRM